MTICLAVLSAVLLRSSSAVLFERSQSTPPTAGSAITGTVRDTSGMVIAGAAIVVRSASGAEARTFSGADGRFQAAVTGSGDVLLFVSASGFEDVRRSIPDGESRQNVDVVLRAAPVMESVTVTATRTEQHVENVAASITLLERDAIDRSPAVVADDALRQLPTFSLFRRTSSLVAHPTTQGVSLRSIGPSGVSRSLVLLDGVPFNDAFGGWVYWTRVPLESVDRIEIVDSTSSSLYGNYAIGGVINIVTAPATRRTIELRTQYGSRDTPKVDVFASDVWRKLRLLLDANAFSTDGYPPVVASERGLVDNEATVSFQNINLKLEYAATERVNAFLRTGYFSEKRDNGKVSTIDGTEESNRTIWKSASGGVRIRMAGDTQLQLNGFVDVTRLRSNFLAVPAATPPRSVGRMTLNQNVPASSAGASAQVSSPVGRHVLTAGADWRWVDGDSREDGLDPQTGTRTVLERISGGTQQSAGLFVQDALSPTSRLNLTVSARVDRWRNYGAHNLETTVPGGIPTANHKPALPARSDTVASPRVSSLYRATEWLTVWGDVGWGFRAPTLNELYRQFRVGNVLTLANEQLGPERLLGGEAGIRMRPARHVSWRVTWFANRVRDPVSNVTIASTATSVMQQRKNLGSTRILGVQTDIDYRPTPVWSFSGAYLYDNAEVRQFAADPSLVGKRLPQAPQHRGSAQIAFVSPRYATIAASIEATGRQFDDDQNQRVVPGHSQPGLPKYAIVNLTASREVGRIVELLFTVQNLFNQEYFVGTLPTTTGAPRLVSGGVRVRLSGRPRSK